MSNELQTKLDAILEDKNTNLLPEHLKAGVTCLGVEGNLESGNTEFGIVKSVEELHALENVKEHDKVIVYDEPNFKGLYEYKYYQDLKTWSLPIMNADTSYTSGATSYSITKNSNTRKYNRAKLCSLIGKIIKDEGKDGDFGGLMVYEVNGALEASYASRTHSDGNTYYDDYDIRPVISGSTFVTGRLTTSINLSTLPTAAKLYRFTLDLENQSYTRREQSYSGSHGKARYFTVSGLNTVPMYVRYLYETVQFYSVINYSTDTYITTTLPADTSTIVSPAILDWTYTDTQLSDIAANQLLEGLTAYSDSGIVTGNIKNNGDLIYEASDMEQIIPTGYINSGKIKPSIVGAKLFENEAALIADNSSAYDGVRFGMIYGKDYEPYLPGSTVTKLDFAKTIILSSPVTGPIEGAVRYGDPSYAGRVDFLIELDPTYCKMYRESGPGYTTTLFEYTSDDGIIYTRTTASDTFTLGIGDDYPWTADYNEVVSNFVRCGDYTFNGVYKWDSDTSKIPLYKIPEKQEDDTFVVKTAINETILSDAVQILLTKAIPNMNVRTSMTQIPFMVVRKSDTVYQFHYYCSKTLTTTDRYIYDTYILYDAAGYHIGGYPSTYFDPGWYYVEVNTQTNTYTHNTCEHREGYNMNFHFGYTFLDSDLWTHIRVNKSTGVFTKSAPTMYNLDTIYTLTIPNGQSWVPATNQLTATSDDIAIGKTAYINGSVAEGTMQAGIDTSDATATSNDLREGKTAYVNGEKIEGTLSRITYISNISNEGIVNTANIDVVDVSGAQYFTITSNNPYMSNEETDESIALTEGYMGPGGDNVDQVTLCKEVNEVADAIGLTSDKIVSGNTILGVEGVAETVSTTMTMELGKTYIVEFKQNVDESINIAEQIAGNAIKINGFDGIYLMLGDAGFNAGYHNIMYEGETESITLIRGYMDQSTIDLVKAAFGEDNVIIDDTTRGWKQICGGTTTTIRIESTGYINPIMIKPGQIFYNGETVTSGSIDLSSYSWLIESIKEI